MGNQKEEMKEAQQLTPFAAITGDGGQRGGVERLAFFLFYIESPRLCLCIGIFLFVILRQINYL